MLTKLSKTKSDNQSINQSNQQSLWSCRANLNDPFCLSFPSKGL